MLPVRPVLLINICFLLFNSPRFNSPIAIASAASATHTVTVASAASPRVTHSTRQAQISNAKISNVKIRHAQIGQTKSLTSDQCDRLSSQTSATELRDQLEELAIAPQENRIASDLTGLTWIDGTGAFFSATLRRDRVEQVMCQSSPAIDLDPGFTNPNSGEMSDAANELCTQIEMTMSLEEVQQTLGSPGEVLIGEDGFPLDNIRQWTDPATQQMAIVSFNNFGEMAGLSCINPVTIAPNPDIEENPEQNPKQNPKQNSDSETPLSPEMP